MAHGTGEEDSRPVMGLAEEEDSLASNGSGQKEPLSWSLLRSNLMWWSVFYFCGFVEFLLMCRLRIGGCTTMGLKNVRTKV